MDTTNSLMECEECHEVVHAMCLYDFGINCEMRTEVMPNYWKCFTCIKFPKPNEPERDPNEVGEKNNESEESTKTECNIDIVKHEITEDESTEKMDTLQERSSTENKPESNPESNQKDKQETPATNDNPSEAVTIKQEPEAESENCVEMKDVNELDIKQEAAETFSNAERLKLRVNEYLARHESKFGKFKLFYSMEQSERHVAIMQDASILVNIFQYLNTADLLKCRLVSRIWNSAARDKKFSSIIDFTGLKITANMIQMVVNLKPDTLHFDWTNVGKQQLLWLLPKIQSLRKLSLSGLDFSSQVSFNFKKFFFVAVFCIR